MPTAVGPFSFSTRFSRSAMTPNASSQETGSNSPSLSNDAVALAHQRRRQPVGAVHDLGKKIPFDAVEAAIDLGLSVAMGCDHLAVLDPDHDAATGAAKAAGRL